MKRWRVEFPMAHGATRTTRTIAAGRVEFGQRSGILYLWGAEHEAGTDLVAAFGPGQWSSVQPEADR